MVSRYPAEARVEGSLWEPGRRAGLIAVGPEQRPPCGVFCLLTLLLCLSVKCVCTFVFAYDGECLPSNHKALASMSDTTLKKELPDWTLEVSSWSHLVYLCLGDKWDQFS